MIVKVGKIEDFFLSSYTGQGYFSFFNDRLEKAKEVYLIQGGTSRIRSRIMRNLAINFVDRGYQVQRVHSPANLKNLEGLIIPELGILFIGEDCYRLLSTELSLNWKKVLELNDILDEEKFRESKDRIHKMLERINIHRELVYENLRKLEELEEKLEDIYQESVNFHKVNELEEKFIEKILDI